MAFCRRGGKKSQAAENLIKVFPRCDNLAELVKQLAAWRYTEADHCHASISQYNAKER